MTYNINQWNRTESPERGPTKIWSTDFLEDAKTIKWEKDNLFNKGAGIIGWLYAQK